ncbi:hypothetical protein CQA49_08320 [Helicobacter sp. MIT 00-7814]|uniref:c-type cytochrome n=1 Tax=Helicobacter sp. MIT 00-7814 TaxID=2040650 RepID=UPI000E1F72C7|nr:c-type cytochrome [Helicobacter sp. MIT 00-7814]RDU52441.1 hypothetical protein CQA49_08320 [Helicobacter sp. MIT 00-7814]
MKRFDMRLFLGICLLIFMSYSVYAQSADTPQQRLMRGGELYKRCESCHGSAGDKIPPGKEGGAIAKLEMAYVYEQLKAYRDENADNGGAKGIMSANIKRWEFKDEELEDLAIYVGGIKYSGAITQQLLTEIKEFEERNSVDGFYWQVAAYKGEPPKKLLETLAKYPHIVHKPENDKTKRYMIGPYPNPQKAPSRESVNKDFGVDDTFGVMVFALNPSKVENEYNPMRLYEGFYWQVAAYNGAPSDKFLQTLKTYPHAIRQAQAFALKRYWVGPFADKSLAPSKNAMNRAFGVDDTFGVRVVNLDSIEVVTGAKFAQNEALKAQSGAKQNDINEAKGAHDGSADASGGNEQGAQTPQSDRAEVLAALSAEDSTLAPKSQNIEIETPKKKKAKSKTKPAPKAKTEASTEGKNEGIDIKEIQQSLSKFYWQVAAYRGAPPRKFLERLLEYPHFIHEVGGLKRYWIGPYKNKKEAPSKQELNKAFEVNDTFERKVESDENGVILRF